MKQKKLTNFPSIIKNVADLVPYARNSRLHSEEQIQQVANSIFEFGFTNPVIIDENGGIIAGHCRVLAAKKLGFVAVPCVQVSGWTENQKKAYVIADNKLALNADWDEKMLSLEFQDLKDAGFDLALTGFEVSEVGGFIRKVDLGDNNPYTAKIEAPIYTPKEEQKPKISELYDDSKTKELVARIKASDLSANEKAFLTLAAQRHTSFNFKAIAEFYAHSDKDVQEFMEESALVIIDFDKAIELGYVDLTDALAVQFSEDKPPQVSDEAEDEADE